MEYQDGCNTLQDLIINNKYITDRGSTFIYSDDKKVFLSYKELYDKALFILGQFQDKGLRERDELIFQIEDNYNFVTCFWACMLGGIIPIPITVNKNEEHFSKFLNIFNLLENPYVIIEKELNKHLEGYLSKYENIEKAKKTENNIIRVEELEEQNIKGEIVKCSANDIAFIQFSSGSTGEPKGVILTHGNLMANTEGILEGIKCTEKDSTFSWMPLTHDMGLIGFHLSPFRAQINQYFMQTSLFIFRPLLWMKKVSEYKATILSSPNFGYKYFIKFYMRKREQDWDLQNVRVIFNGAEPISCSVCDNFCELMSKYGMKKNVMFPVYGLAEASLAVAFPPIGEGITSVKIDRRYIGIGQKVRYCEDENSVIYADEGYPIKNCSVHICNEDNEELEENVVGYIKIRGTNVTKGFYKNLEETNRIIDSDGWLNTKDLGFINDGRLIVTGRAKDIIFVNGVNYYSHDIEELLSQLPGIELGKVAVCGSRNAKKECEEIIVFVVFRGEIEKFLEKIEEIKYYINLKLGISINCIISITKMPKTTSGKLQRFKLVKRYVNNEFDEQIKEIGELTKQDEEAYGADASLSETEQRLLDMYIKIFENNNLKPEDNLIELGGDSLTLTRIQEEVNRVYSEKVNIAHLFTYPSIKQLANFLDNRNSSYEPSIYLDKKYGENKGRKESVTYKYVINGEVREKLQNIVTANNYICDQFLLSVYFYVFLQESNSQKVNIYVGSKELNLINRVTVLNEEIDDFDKFVKKVMGNSVNSELTNSLTQLSTCTRKRTENSIWISFINNELVDGRLDLINIFDFNLIVREAIDKEITLKVQFNTDVINEENAKRIFNSYINMINYLIEKIY